MNQNEAATRSQLIDIQLAQAGWGVSQRNVLEETRLRATDSIRLREQDIPYQTERDEFVDYELFNRNGRTIAIVEAKRTSRNPLEGERQAADYADRIQQLKGIDPFIFLTNGHEIWFWDRSLYPPRQISGFLSPDDLEKLDFQRRYRTELRQQSPRTEIINRYYQIEAVKRVTEAIDGSQRHFLLVMATGTGKTRTAVALIDLLFRARWVQRVLFLADRRELVRQALGDFKEHMPHESRARIEGGTIDHDARIHVGTYPSMMQVYRQLSVGYYDLIIADESHRSVYSHYKALLDYFDALQLGLTATPTDYIDHNTYELFACTDGLPTFYYPYEVAVAEQHLADYRVHHALTNFQIDGIRAGQLPDEWQKTLEAQGIDLSEINFTGSDLERRVTNRGTTDAIVREFMEFCRRDASGTLPGKTIFFAMSHNHAMEILKSFNRLYPSLQRQGFAQVIDSQVERAERILDDFKRRDMPRIAISVDMLDTGVDIPAIQNLAFAKPVFSQVKFWQMIGRGTRLWTDPQSGTKKETFLILDFWNNFHYFNMNPEGEAVRTTEPLPVRLFRLRLDKLLLLRGLSLEEDATATCAQLRAMLSQVPLDNVNVRPHIDTLHQLAMPETWQTLEPPQLQELRQTIAPLLRFMAGENLDTLTFAVKAEGLATAHLAGEQEKVAQYQASIVEDLQLLPTDLTEIAAVEEKLIWMQSDGFWTHLDYGRILALQNTFAPLMRYRQRRRQDLITLNLPDQIASRWIMYGPSGEGTLKETYRAEVEAHVRELAEQHPTLRKVQAGQPVTDDDIASLAQTLNQADLFITEENLRKTYDQPHADLLDFIEHMLQLVHLPSREEEVRLAFDRFIADHAHFTATQISFLRMVRAMVLRQTRLTTATLARPPFNRIGLAEQLFDVAELTEIVSFANTMINESIDNAL